VFKGAFYNLRQCTGIFANKKYWNIHLTRVLCVCSSENTIRFVEYFLLSGMHTCLTYVGHHSSDETDS